MLFRLLLLYPRCVYARWNDACTSTAALRPSAALICVSTTALVLAQHAVPTMPNSYTALFNVTTPTFSAGVTIKVAVLPFKAMMTLDVPLAPLPVSLCVDAGTTQVKYNPVQSTCNYTCNRGQSCPAGSNCQVS